MNNSVELVSFQAKTPNLYQSELNKSQNNEDKENSTKNEIKKSNKTKQNKKKKKEEVVDKNYLLDLETNKNIKVDY